MAHDERAVMAANNNADLYQAVFASWDLRYERRSFAFLSKDRPPPYYSNLIVLSANCVSQIISYLKAAAHLSDGAFSFKDSFCEFDLGADGFELLFTASWIWRPAEAISSAQGWSKVENSLDLEKWEAAWKRSGSPTPARMFRDAMLQARDIVLLGKMEAGNFVSGCIANISSDCVGISNVFSISQEQRTFHEATAAVASINPRLPIVGYGAGPHLDAAGRAGYETTGSLRILVAKNARF